MPSGSLKTRSAAEYVRCGVGTNDFEMTLSQGTPGGLLAGFLWEGGALYTSEPQFPDIMPDESGRGQGWSTCLSQGQI
jgi:hypothetical protein